MKDRITLGVRYRYAPETFFCSVNGKRFPVPDPSRLGVLLISGHGDEVEAEIKREIRKIRTQRRRVTIGFWEKSEKPKRYFYTRELGAYDDDLQDKLRIYKNWKQFCLSRNCDLATHEVTSGSFVPFGKGKTTTGVTHDYVDLTKPIKLRYPYEREMV